MALTSAALVAQSIVTSLGIPASAQPAALTVWTDIVTKIRDMVLASTVTINAGTVATGVMAGAATVPVTGSATLT